jgi:hypothetical protein
MTAGEVAPIACTVMLHWQFTYVWDAVAHGVMMLRLRPPPRR